MSKTEGVASTVREIRCKTRRKYAAEEKIRIVLEGLRGEESISALCRREGIAPNLYYSWKSGFCSSLIHTNHPTCDDSEVSGYPD